MFYHILQYTKSKGLQSSMLPQGTIKCGRDSQLPTDTGTPEWHHSSRGNQPPSSLRQHQSGCGDLDGQRDSKV